MDFITRHQLLNRSFNPNNIVTPVAGLQASIINCRFESRFPGFEPVAVQKESHFDYDLAETWLAQNNSFSYPVIVPEKNTPTNRVILLLHGLNERSWEKYLVWADFLAEQTGHAVILFPIAFHMNRSPEEWNNARAMSQVAAKRKQVSPELKDATYVNAALSTRIENRPEQFLLSGMQSYLDVIQLVKSIDEGKHPLFRKGTRVDIFSYSIGAFLSQLLVMDNSNDLFSDTKLCLFCGGATFDRLNGASRFIMDSRAFQRLRTLADFNNFARLKQCFKIRVFRELKNSWETLRFMTFLNEGRAAREKVLQQIGERIYAIGLANDTVVPPAAILQTLKGPNGYLPTKVDVFDFPYPYTHESPFPVNNQHLLSEVDAGFRQVFSRVADFLK